MSLMSQFDTKTANIKTTNVLLLVIILGVMVFNTTFNNISVRCILWQSVLLVEENGVPGENNRHVTDKLSH